MLDLATFIVYTTVFDLIHSEQIKHNTLCVTGSIISTLVDGKYKYKDTNEVGTIYYNEEANLYLFPFIESQFFKQYLIGDDPTSDTHYSYSTIQEPMSYTFNEEDFIASWHSYMSNNNGTRIVNDISMRLVNCDCVHINSTIYKWINYSLSTESSIYYNIEEDLYLSRSNINTPNEIEIWKMYGCDSKNKQRLSPQSVHFGMCTNTIINDTDIINANGSGTEQNDSTHVLIAVIATTVALLVIVISIVIIIKKHAFCCGGNITKSHGKAERAYTNSEINHKSETNSNISNKQSKEFKIRIERDLAQKKSTSLYNDYVYREYKRDSEYQIDISDIRKASISAYSDKSINSDRKKSTSKYADILPPSKPPPIGMKPVLTAQQQSARPLPPTPPAKKTIL